MSLPTLRRAAAADADAVRDLTRRAYAKWVPVIGREPMPMQADYHDVVRRHIVELLLLDETLAALIECIPAERHLLIENVAVAPEHQGKGFGKRLLHHAEALARDLGFGEVKLYTNALFAENVALYHRLGYVREREEPFKGGTAVHMRKALPDQETGTNRDVGRS